MLFEKETRARLSSHLDRDPESLKDLIAALSDGAAKAKKGQR